MKFTIERSTWRCGCLNINLTRRNGEGLTKLLNREGFRCCLGSVCSQLGVPDDKLLDIEYPSSGHLSDFPIDILRTRNPFGLGIENTQLAQDAININDSSALLTDKEAQLIELFAKHGHQLEFVGNFANDKSDVGAEDKSSCSTQSTPD